jgi:hypothetical protein
MKDNYRIASVEALSDGHSIWVRWTDGLEGVIDALPWIEGGGIFEALRDPERFKDVRVAEYGHNIYWLTEDGYEIDICPDVLRAKVDSKVAAWIAELERRYAEEQSAG